jgi:hypothetical protein
MIEEFCLENERDSSRLFAPRRATMVFDTECKAVNDPYGGERLAMEAVRTRQAAATSR